jgi:hypothetical protein
LNCEPDAFFAQHWQNSKHLEESLLNLGARCFRNAQDGEPPAANFGILIHESLLNMVELEEMLYQDDLSRPDPG